MRNIQEIENDEYELMAQSDFIREQYAEELRMLAMESEIEFEDDGDILELPVADVIGRSSDWIIENLPKKDEIPF